MAEVQVRWKAWHGDELCTLRFPSSCEVEVCGLPVLPALDHDRIENAILSPIGAQPLRFLAHGRQTAAVAVDDLSRPTPSHHGLSVVLSELRHAGLKDSNVSIVVALGTHPKLSEGDLCTRFERSILQNYKIVQHDPHDNLREIGISLDGHPVRINQDFSNADVKVLMGCITPHSFAGFSGGGKMVLPGLANFEIIERIHRSVLLGFKGGLGVIEGNRFRKEIQAVCQQCGIDFIVDVVLNQDRDISGIFAGHLDTAYRQGVAFARKSYRTSLPSMVDVAILNAYPKDTDLIQSENAFNLYRSAKQSFVREDGIVVLMTAGSRGLGRHGLFESGEVLARKPRRRRWLGNRSLYIYCPTISKEEAKTAYWEGYLAFQSWDDVITQIQKAFPTGCKIAVFPNSSLQLGGDDAV